jgi:type IV pilus assembly protein PilB
MVRVSGKIRRLLVDSELITDEDWSSARETGQPPVDVLLERGLVPEESLFEVLAAGSGMVPVDLSRLELDDSVADALPKESCEEHCVIPVARNGQSLTIAITDPFDVLLLDDLAILSGCKVRPVLSYPGAIRRALHNIYDNDSKEVESLLGEVEGADLVVTDESEGDDMDIASGADADDVPAVKLVNLLLLRALREKASDIHIEPMDKCLRVRFRVDGRMSETMRPPKAMLPSLISRLKIMASLDIAIRMEPQDGKFQVKYENRKIDFRLSLLPVVGGEKAVMRILDQSGVAGKLEDLGFEDRCLADFKTGVAASYGMVLVTGPTGSGKSTTLYAAVREVARPEINVVTVEDPVEYRMDGINQVPVNPKRGLTFAGALRSILRQDPDVVLVGEIRDTETAEIAVKAALTGHLVLSTLHTNDATQAVTRLVDMGIDPFMVSSSVVCVAAQRLVRSLCKHCAIGVQVPEAELLAVGMHESELEGLELKGPKPGGCPRCSNGYRGRMALLETFALDADIKRMVVEGRSSQDLKIEGIKKGMVTLRRAGLANARRGKTSLEEILRVTSGD